VKSVFRITVCLPAPSLLVCSCGFPAPEVIVETVRNVVGKTPVGVCHAATAAILNGSLHAPTRQELVACGAVFTVYTVANQVAVMYPFFYSVCLLFAMLSIGGAGVVGG
jgi:hypothetical protein